jgi:hypothetical protein
VLLAIRQIFRELTLPTFSTQSTQSVDLRHHLPLCEGDHSITSAAVTSSIDRRLAPTGSTQPLGHDSLEAASL